jgi:hypothetical protein
MTPGLRSHKSASLRVVVSDAIPDDMREQVRELVSVEAGETRKGHASALLRKVCAEADREGQLLIVQVKPYADGLDQQQLMRWYARFGFSLLQSVPVVLMARMRGGVH